MWWNGEGVRVLLGWHVGWSMIGMCGGWSVLSMYGGDGSREWLFFLTLACLCVRVLLGRILDSFDSIRIPKHFPYMVSVRTNFPQLIY